MGEGGRRLSGGQRQRLVIARVLTLPLPLPLTLTLTPTLTQVLKHASGSTVQTRTVPPESVAYWVERMSLTLTLTQTLTLLLVSQEEPMEELLPMELPPASG